MSIQRIPYLALLLIPLLSSATLCARVPEKPQPVENWLAVVRQSPYWISKGAFQNFKTVRRWLLSGESFCEVQDRHILFDRRGSFLGYIADAKDAESTQAKINRLRRELVKSGRADVWVAGGAGRFGYPFALSCHQPHAQLDQALARYSGTDEEARLWGTWDGMRVGTQEKRVSLHKAIVHVYRDRSERGRISLPDTILSTLAGKAMIESAGQKLAHSAADARGILQLSQAALQDCDLAERFHFHRLAQIDCALRLLEQNHRNLRPVFDRVFGHLPAKKAEELYNMLLLQAYHGGVGRIVALLTESELNAATRYFAQHHERFSAGDIALGLVFHNLGRNQLGFASLYYVVDVAIAVETACEKIDDLPGC